MNKEVCILGQFLIHGVIFQKITQPLYALGFYPVKRAAGCPMLPNIEQCWWLYYWYPGEQLTRAEWEGMYFWVELSERHIINSHYTCFGERPLCQCVDAALLPLMLTSVCGSSLNP